MDPSQKFKTRAGAEAFIPLFAERYRIQGYYKTASCERIPFEQIAERCHVEEFEPTADELNVLRECYSVLCVGAGAPEEEGCFVCSYDEELHKRVLAQCEARGLDVEPMDLTQDPNGRFVDAGQWLDA
jgi:hypothetical protein